MEYLGGGHRVGALGSEERRGQGELPGEVGLDWTSKDGQNLNRWSHVSLPNIVIRSVGPECSRAVGGSLSGPRVAPSPSGVCLQGVLLFLLWKRNYGCPLEIQRVSPANFLQENTFSTPGLA